MKCTWSDCTAEGTKPQTGRDGSVWATLCEGHNEKLEAAIVSGDAKKLMGAYIKAQGGAKAAADRMAPAATKVIAAIVDAAKNAKGNK